MLLWQNIRQIAALLTVAAGCLHAISSPAPWYVWQSKQDGKLTCTQTSPGEGWVKLAGPFTDARCGRAS